MNVRKLTLIPFTEKVDFLGQDSIGSIYFSIVVLNGSFLESVSDVFKHMWRIEQRINSSSLELQIKFH
jgi:hypothetical protein